ncbi:PTS sugar transporter subunit IIA [Natronogracilivirga saccharolytica]|uniref:PTS sugar transporter subunit IIA n=1 Tax=Natronogracilivirga saccharolytica TaxID=2812953 RepID=A0A8J7RIE1_9BACT|nr:PTS sugar transporter subunit IIA [Natronogracilivirga saccharolytica]MBP3192355.1 PTS sugar transporter subunit IIA [Natronogracilivirga saccharolytica]
MKISDLLDESNVIPGLSARTKNEAIDKLVDTLSDKLDGETIKSVRKAVLERENIMSTGVGKGLAIPHGKSKQLSQTYAAFGKLEEPVEYNAIDGEPVHILFLLVGPESQNSVHIKMLSRISRLLNSSAFREKLVASNDVNTIIDLFRSEEEHFVRI